MNRRRLVSITALGLVTIAGYGAWFYAFGVLLDPIIADTQWSEGTLASGFGAGMATGGLLAVPAGRLLDRTGSRPVFLLAAAVSTTGLWLGAGARTVGPFLLLTGIAAAALAALAFYHITQTTAIRVAPDEPTKAIALLTIYGALASAIYLPLAAALIEAVGWRSTVRTLAAVTGVILVAGGFLVSEEERPDRTARRVGIRAALRDPTVARFAAASAASGFGVGVLLVYQVPLMTAAGLPLATASWFAGARGAAQLTGRIPLTVIVGRLGTRRSMILSYGAVLVGTVILGFAGTIVFAALFALIAGFGIGAASAVQGLYANDLFERAELGTMMGVLTLLHGVFSALGPAVAGILAEATGTRSWALVLAAGSAALAAGFLWRRPVRVATP